MLSIVRLWSAIFFALLIVSTTRPALAVEGNWWFWTTANDANPLPYAECLRRAPGAISAQGLTPSPRGNGNVFTTPPGQIWVSLMCLPQPRGFWMILNVSTDGSRSSQAVGDAIGSAFFSGSMPGTNSVGVIGSWNWSASCTGGNASGVFTISNMQPDGTFGGSLTDAVNSSTNGSIVGRFQFGTVTFKRYWGGNEKQQWSGSLDQSGVRISGTISGEASCSFSATRQ